MLEISITDDKLRKLCEEQKVTNKKLGKDCAKKLRTRLSDLTAADNVKELVAGRPHPLTGDRKGQYSVDLCKGLRLVFEADDPVPTLKDKGIDWSKVTEITIVFIGDYHD